MSDCGSQCCTQDYAGAGGIGLRKAAPAFLALWQSAGLRLLAGGVDLTHNILSKNYPHTLATHQPTAAGSFLGRACLWSQALKKSHSILISAMLVEQSYTVYFSLLSPLTKEPFSFVLGQL